MSDHHALHDHDDEHDHHDHSHDHASHNKDARLLGWATLLTALFMVVEVVGGLMSNSLALLADAGHMLTDSVALAMAWGALYFSRRAPDAKRSFGYQRLQVLATFVNGLALMAIVVGIGFEAIQKLLNPTTIDAPLMLGVAAIGTVVNVVVFAMLRSGDHDNMNMAAALLHVLGDLLGSIGAVIGAIVITYTHFTAIDPLLSVVLCLLIVRSAWLLVRRSTHILLEGAPDWLNVDELRRGLEQAIPEITDVHHVHCWTLSPRETLLTCHATVTEGAQHPHVLAQTQTYLAERFGITHATIQLEAEICAEGDHDCSSHALPHAEHSH
jgi:cobalt-zinc-cadmium efflux system protein